MLTFRLPAFSSTLPPYSDHHDVSDESWQDAPDTADWLNAEDAWHDARDHFSQEKAAENHVADHYVPVTEDFLRGVKSFIGTLARYHKNQLLNHCLASCFPHLPLNIIRTAEHLYHAIINKEAIDLALLNTLELSVGLLPEENIFSCLASEFKDTITQWTQDSYFGRVWCHNQEDSQESIFLALAVATLAANYFLNHREAPQRGIFKTPNFIANMLIRANHYWQFINNVALYNHASPPLLDVHTSINTERRNGSDPVITAYQSYSTFTPGQTITETDINPTFSLPNTTLSFEETIHQLTVAKHMQLNSLNQIAYCQTKQWEDSRNDDEITRVAARFITKCNVSSDPPMSAPTQIFYSDNNIGNSAKHAASSADPRRTDEVLIPFIVAGTVSQTTLAQINGHPLSSRLLSGLVILLSLSGTAALGKVLFDMLSSATSPRVATGNNDDTVKAEEDSTDDDYMEQSDVEETGADNDNTYLTTEEKIQLINTLELFNLTSIINYTDDHHREKRQIDISPRKTKTIFTIFNQHKSKNEKEILNTIYRRALESDEVRQFRGKRRNIAQVMKCIQIIESYIAEDPENNSGYNILNSVLQDLYQLLNGLITPLQYEKFVREIKSHQQLDLINYGVVRKQSLINLLQKNETILKEFSTKQGLSLSILKKIAIDNRKGKIINKIALYITGDNEIKFTNSTSLSIINNYIYNSLIKTSLLTFLNTSKPGTLSVSLYQHLYDSFNTEINRKENGISKNEIFKILNYFNEKVLLNFLPALDNRFSNYPIDSSQWGLLHVGLINGNRLGIDCRELNENQLYSMGALALKLLSEGKIPSSWTDVFLLPARIRFSLNNKELAIDNRSLDTITEEYLEFLSNASEKHYDLFEKQEGFFESLKQFKNRTDFTEIIQPINGGYFMRENDGSIIEFPSTDPDINYEHQNQQLKKHFYDVEKAFIEAAIDELPEDEKTLLRNSTITRLNVKLSADFFPSMGKEIIPGMFLGEAIRTTVDLEPGFVTFSAKTGSDESIFSLWKTNIGYVAARTDNTTLIYQKHIADKEGLYHNFKFTINTPSEIKGYNDSMTIFVNNVAERNANDFYHAIFDMGYGRTTFEKVMSYIVPFYDCALSIKEKDTANAIISCSLDTINLLVPVTKAASLATKATYSFGKSFFVNALKLSVKESGNSLRKVLSQSGKTLIINGLTPVSSKVTRKDIVSLGIAFAREFDPGFHLAYQIGKVSVKSLKKIIKEFESLTGIKIHYAKPGAHSSFFLSDKGGYLFGISNGIICNLGTRVARAPGGIKLSCFSNPAKQVITQLAEDFSKEWNQLSTAGRNVKQRDLITLEMLSERTTVNIPAIEDYAEAGSGPVNNFLRYGIYTGVKQDIENTASQLLSEYDKLADYYEPAYRIMNIRPGTLQGLKKGNVITDKGFVSCSALVPNLNSWYRDAWISQNALAEDLPLIIVYSNNVEKRIASTDFLVDHLLIKPNTPLEINKVFSVSDTKKKAITVIVVSPAETITEVKDIYTGDILPPI